MSKWIIIPDVHGRTFWRDAVQCHEEDKIIFLGDYVDPYEWEGIKAKQAFNELLDILEFKKKHPDNVVLLLGNHDLGYLESLICNCRRDHRHAKKLKKIFRDNLDLFNLVHIEEYDGVKVLFSHAGIAESWIHRRRDIVGDPACFHPEHLNQMLHGDDAQRNRLFLALSDVSQYRGGLDWVGSPVWADVNEYLNGERLLEGYLHIFGHTLHEGGPIGIRDHGICLDCAQAFSLDAPTGTLCK